MNSHQHRVVAIVQARTASSRLPGKVVLPLRGRPLLFHVIQRLRACERLDHVLIATTREDQDDAIEEFGKLHEVTVYRGPTDDVLARYVGAAAMAEATVVVRITADCPLIDPVTVDRAIEEMLSGNGSWDCVNVGVGGGFPRGLDCEVIRIDTLLQVGRVATAAEDREHVSSFILHRKHVFRVLDLTAPPELAAPDLRLCVDEPADFRLIELIYDRMYNPHTIIDVRKVVDWLKREPELAAINAHVQQKKLTQSSP